MRKLLLLALFAFPAQTWASGCMWTLKYVLGKKLSTRESEGYLSCRYSSNYPGSGFEKCTYTDGIEVVKKIFTSYKIAYGPSLSEKIKVKVQIDNYEAMSWDDCDGETPPEYEPNGNLDKFEIIEKEFVSFTKN